MRREHIDALMRAHGGRARPVAFLHVMRQVELSEGDHGFLREHIGELGLLDLLRWRRRCEAGFTAHVIREIARRAVGAPATFRCEVLDAPRLGLDGDEWRELAELLGGRVPAQVFEALITRSRERPEPAEAASDNVFSARIATEIAIDLSLDMEDEGNGAGAPHFAVEPVHQAPPARQSVESLLLGTFDWGASINLSRELGTRAAWERNGVEVMSTMIATEAFSELSDLVALVVSAAPPQSAAALIDAMHFALASALIKTVRQAVEAGDTKRAMAALSALTCLDPPSRLSPALHALGEIEVTDPWLSALLTVNQQTVRRGRSKQATFEGFVAALHALVDALQCSAE